MARLIHTLKSANVNKEKESPCVAEQETYTIKLHTEEDAKPMSFIEVGGSQPMEASPDVLSVPVPRNLLHPASEPVQAETNDTNQENWNLQFQPWTKSDQPGYSTFSGDLVAIHKPDHPLCKHYLSMLDSLLLPEQSPQFLFITTMDKELHVSNIIVNLAILTAREHEKPVVILDFNNRPGNATELCGLEPTPNLTDVLAGRVSLENVLQPTAVSNLSVVRVNCPNGKTWQKELLEWVVNWLKGRCEVAFVDFSPLELKKESIAVASFCDSVIPVIREDCSDQSGKALLEELAQHITQIRGYICCNRRVK